jgi:hypothetical protein
LLVFIQRISSIFVGGWDALLGEVNFGCREMWRWRTRISEVSAEKGMRKDRFTEHKRQYEIHAAAWLEARARGDKKLSRKSSQQMLRHLQKMYQLALSSKS